MNKWLAHVEQELWANLPFVVGLVFVFLFLVSFAVRWSELSDRDRRIEAKKPKRRFRNPARPPYPSA